jgi:hypothetical protein
MSDQQRNLKLNIGLIVFVVIFIYIAANAVMYLTRSHVSFCEAQPGRIVDSDSFTGFILRNEAVVGSDKSGYISYFINDGDKAAKDSNVCMIQSSSQSASDGNSISSDNYSFSTSDYSDIREQITTYKKNYNDSDYEDIYNLDYQLNNIVSRVISRNNISTIDFSSGSSGTYTLMTAAENAIISYTYDGMEGYTTSDMKPELFTKEYEKVQLSAGTYINRQDPAYKMIYNDDWQIILYPTSEQYDKLKELENVDITFTKDNITTTADVTVFENGGEHYVSLSLSNYMIRYYNDRYLDIEIVWDSHDGLKIPTSAITTKEFYVIPTEYLIESSDSTEKGFYVSGEDGPELIKPTIYRQTDDFCYVDRSSMDEGTVLIAKDSGTQYKVGTTEALKGVYNINKGYALFRLIDILYEYGDYCIIDDNTKYGVNLYDHIILDGNSAYENEVIY